MSGMEELGVEVVMDKSVTYVPFKTCLSLSRPIWQNRRCQSSGFSVEARRAVSEAVDPFKKAELSSLIVASKRSWLLRVKLIEAFRIKTSNSCFLVRLRTESRLLPSKGTCRTLVNLISCSVFPSFTGDSMQIG